MKPSIEAVYNWTSTFLGYLTIAEAQLQYCICKITFPLTLNLFWLFKKEYFKRALFFIESYHCEQTIVFAAG